ncbi:MAG: alpha/beta fold hydrolase [Paracoccaceae bacterium]|nr:alpha/beta fold hydrolase [Paracoccaceae bacterium]
MTLTTLLLSETNRKVTFRRRGKGEPLVLIHGVGMQSAAWAPQIAEFAKHYCVIALDMPGHGGSDPLPTESQLTDYVAWCRATLEDLNIAPVNLVGHSMGALIAGGVAVSYPHLVRRIALLNAVFRRDEAAKAAVKARAAEIRNGKVDLETPLARWFGDEDAKARAQVAMWLSAIDVDGYATAYGAFAQGDAIYARRFAEIACPCLALTGEGDPNSTPAMAQAMADTVQDGVAITLPGHRHMVNLTAVADVNAQLRTWLKRPIHQKEMQ